jgi:rhomboid family GlyGly-CTERM serine protease
VGQRVRLSAGWLALCAACAAGALLAWFVPRGALDWQPALAAAQPWRALSAPFVHWSALHLGANLAGTIVVGALGVAAALPARAALAWLAAWPLTQLGLLVAPGLLHYGGLSGVLHAAVAVAGVWLAIERAGRERGIGCALLGGLALKVLLEAPWGPPLRNPPGWDIAIAPLAHATGALAGVACALLASTLAPRPVRSAR